MQLHSLAPRRPGPVAGGARGAGDRSDMICFYCQDERGHVEVQFVDFRVTFSELSEILQRLYRKVGAVGFSYELPGRGVETVASAAEL
eukprot:3397044-Rhodomonas_salina.1